MVMKYNHHKEWLHRQQDRILKIECHLAGTVHLNCVYLWWNVKLVEKVFPMGWRVGCWICTYGHITVVLLVYLHSNFYSFFYANSKVYWSWRIQGSTCPFRQWHWNSHAPLSLLSTSKFKEERLLGFLLRSIRISASTCSQTPWMVYQYRSQLSHNFQ